MPSSARFGSFPVAPGDRLEIYGYARRVGLPDADAADISQEMLSEVARCIRSFEYQPDRGRFRDWLGTLVRRKVSRFLKKKGREPSDAAADAGWSGAFNARILSAAMERARPHCEPATWRAFERVWPEDRRAGDVAAELGGAPASGIAKGRGVVRELTASTA
jgi:RNA polymerase sigma-70 factor (ECF subfamily)